MKVLKILLVIFLALLNFTPERTWGSFDLGTGTSSISSGRGLPSLALGLDNGTWALFYRSLGAQTTIYSQNAWTLAADKIILSEKYAFLNTSMGAGLGVTYVLQKYRSQSTAEIATTSETVIGPHFALKFQFGLIYLGFDTILGLTSDLIQHVALNFQDVSYFTVGISL